MLARRHGGGGAARHATRHHGNHSATAGLPCALATPSYAGHFSVLAQWFLTLEANVVDVEACSLLVVTSSEAEVHKLRKLLRESYGSRLPRVMRQLTIVDFHSALRRLSPATTKALSPTKDGAPRDARLAWSRGAPLTPAVCPSLTPQSDATAGSTSAPKSLSPRDGRMRCSTLSRSS